MAKKDWRLIQTWDLDGFRNMAIDEALMLSHCLHPHTLPVLRFYTWKPAGFSLGYSQDPEREFNLELMQQDNIYFVRRITGGGIIFHDDELTYSLCCFPQELSFKGGVRESYKYLCAFILEGYRRLGLKADFACQHSFQALGRFHSFCFWGREHYDIVIDERKIGGNAQRRKKNFIFQHGSIPFSFNSRILKYLNLEDRDIFSKKITVLDEYLKIEKRELLQVLKLTFAEVFSVRLWQDGLSKEEEHLAQVLYEKKYTTPVWNRNRLSLEGEFRSPSQVLER